MMGGSHCLRQHSLESFEIHGFGQKFIEAGFAGALADFFLAVAAESHQVDGLAGKMPADQFRDLVAIKFARKTQIRNNDSRLESAHHGEGRGTIVDDLHIMACCLEQTLECLGGIAIVVHNQDRSRLTGFGTAGFRAVRGCQMFG